MSLQDFVAAAHRDVAQGRYAPVGKTLRSHGSLAQTMREGIIAELKPRSPSAGQLLRQPTGRILEQYARGGADALSVLTQSTHFGGNMELLRQAHATGLPTLMKDFVVDAAQVHAAADAGASAVLLIERILTPAQRDRLIQEAHGAGLEVLLEVHGIEEWQRAQHADADLWGVNARDLDTLAVDPDGQREVLRAASASSVPVVALSGIADRYDRMDAHAAGADGVLVGTMLMRQLEPALALRALRRPLVKVCGITNEDDLHHAIDAGADMVGLVCMADTPRSISAEQAAPLVAQADAAGVVPVLVTPEQEKQRVLAAALKARPRFVQWHHPPPGGPGALQAAGFGVLAAVGPGHEQTAAGCDGIVLDSPSGGSGQVHDWRRAREVAQRHRGVLSLIAGGLDASLASDAVAATRTWGADASSRLEATPGRKDPDKVRAYVEAVHG